MPKRQAKPLKPRVHLDDEALRDAAVVAWRAVCLDPEKIRTICAVPFLNERRHLF